MEDTVIDDSDILGPADGEHRWREEVLENNENSLIFADENTIQQPNVVLRTFGAESGRALGPLISPPLPFGSVLKTNGAFSLGLDTPTQVDRTPAPAVAHNNAYTPTQVDNKEATTVKNGENRPITRQNVTKSHSDGDTPFLRHLPDPYEDTGNDTSGNNTILSQSPLKGRVHVKKAANFPQIREEHELSSAETEVLPKDHQWASAGSAEQLLGSGPQELTERGTQGTASWPGDQDIVTYRCAHDNGRLNDTQVIPQDPSNDTQLVSKLRGNFTNDTQIISKDTQNSIGDTQDISKFGQNAVSDTQVIPMHHHDDPKDTQIIPAYAINDLKDTQVISNNPNSDSQNSKDSQFVSIHYKPHVIIKNTQESSTHITDKNDDNYQHFGGGENAENSSIHLPHEPTSWETDPQPFFQHDVTLSDTEKSPKTTTQVVNTQEDAADDTVEAVDLARKPVYSSSQRPDGEVDMDLEIIETDEENGESALLDGEIMAPRLNKRRLDFEDEIPKKSTKFDSHRAVCSTADTPFSEPLLQITRRPLPSSPTNEPDSSSSLSDLSLSVREVRLVSHSQHGEIFERSQASQRARTQPTDEEGDKSVVYSRPRRNQTTFVAHSQQPSKDQGISEEEIGGGEQEIHEEPAFMLDESSILHKDSVWAFYKFKIYTGRVLTHIDTESLVVLFEEGESSVKNTDLHFLDIRIGDRVKIRSQNYEYIVTGLKNGGPSRPIQCMRGFHTAVLKRIKGRNTIEAPLSECYMELSDWVVHQQTYQLVFQGKDLLKSHVSVVSSLLFGDKRASSTPEVPELLRKESLRISPRKVAPEGHQKVFSRMLFCLTSIVGDDKMKVSSLITENGGVVIDEGLSLQMEYLNNAETGCLELILNTLEEYVFGAVIANTHCRSAKYFEGLALGWPILSEAFISACVEDHSMVDKWHIFVLPAGQSQHLNSVKSLEVFRFREQQQNGLSLSHQLANNSGLLAKYHIVALSSGVNLLTLDTYKFIFHAFGAASLRLVASWEAALDVLKGFEEGKVLLYDNSGEASKRFREIERKTTRQRSVLEQGLRSQRNGSEKMDAKNHHGSEQKNALFPVLSKSSTSEKSSSVVSQLQAVGHPSFGLIDWEWVVQCAISGHIWASKTVHLH